MANEFDGKPCSTCKGTGNGGDISHSLSRFVEFPDGSLCYVPGEPYMSLCHMCGGSGIEATRPEDVEE